MHRRSFIQSGCAACLAALAGIPALNGCAPAKNATARPVVENGIITLPIASFDPDPLQIVRAKNLDYDIAVRRTAPGQYEALLLKCTHFDNPLDRSGSGFSCSLHGSRFDAEGKVLRGPAERRLQSYRVTSDTEHVFIHLT